MSSQKYLFKIQILNNATIIPVALLLLAFTMHEPQEIISSNHTIASDTLPQSEIFNLKRSDIYVVIMDGDSVKIRLKNRDSIMMIQAAFDGLPAILKKEISPNKDGVFIREETEST